MREDDLADLVSKHILTFLPFKKEVSQGLVGGGSLAWCVVQSCGAVVCPGSLKGHLCPPSACKQKYTVTL